MRVVSVVYVLCVCYVRVYECMQNVYVCNVCNARYATMYVWILRMCIYMHGCVWHACVLMYVMYECYV